MARPQDLHHPVTGLSAKSAANKRLKQPIIRWKVRSVKAAAAIPKKRERRLFIHESLRAAFG